MRERRRAEAARAGVANPAGRGGPYAVVRPRDETVPHPRPGRGGPERRVPWPWVPHGGLRRAEVAPLWNAPCKIGGERPAGIRVGREGRES